MVRAYSQEHRYHHPWSVVTAASLQKFTDPTTPTVLTHILDVHTLSHRVDPATSVLHLVRSITIRSPTSLPFPLRRLLPHPLLCHCIEATSIDPQLKSMEIVTTNSSLRSLLEVEERSCFRPDADRPEEWTVVRQETRIRCKPLSALAAVAEKVEQRCAERFLVNSAKGREVVERICKCIADKETGSF